MPFSLRPAGIVEFAVSIIDDARESGFAAG
jgi:hypothetical protein